MNNETVLKITQLTKTYKNVKAVDHVNITIKKGDVYGLVGKNGAGKSTLLRIITSLAKQDSGEIQLFGETTNAGLQKSRKRMGSVIESPALYQSLSAAHNLAYYQRLKGIPNKKAINNTLALVGLADTGKKKVKNFSLGMKQRLGLAVALLNNPDFLILDEPLNGLDPMAIVEMRDLIIKLSQEHQITLMISSHLLSELSLVATRYGFIDNGKMINEATADEIAEACQRSLSIKVDDANKASSAIETTLGTRKYKAVSANEIRLYDYIDRPDLVNQKLMEANVRVLGISDIGDNLEAYFVNLLKEGK